MRRCFVRRASSQTLGSPIVQGQIASPPATYMHRQTGTSTPKESVYGAATKESEYGAVMDVSTIEADTCSQSHTQ